MTSQTIVSVLKDILIRMNVPLSKCRGQCCDSCNTMSGSRDWVVVRFKMKKMHALNTYCYGYALNLACADIIKKCKVMKDALDSTHEITKSVKTSPKRKAQLDKI